MGKVNRVLVVEDEALIAILLEDFLDLMGKELAGTVDTVQAALEIIAQGNVDAAILDVHLRGGERSYPVAAALETAGIPFVFASGGSGDTIPDAFSDRPVLMKPFTMEGVARVLALMG